MTSAGKKSSVSFLSCSVFVTPSKTVKPKPPNIYFPLSGSEYDMISPQAPKMDDNWGLTPLFLLDDKNKVVYTQKILREEQDENKKMKSIVVEEQELEEGSEGESETVFVDLDQDTLLNVLKRVDMFTLGRAACVNKLWSKVARDSRLWDPIFIRIWASNGCFWLIDRFRNWSYFSKFFRIRRIKPYLIVIKPLPSDFYLIDFPSSPGFHSTY